MSMRKPLAVDKTVALDINGSTQRIRMCATRPGLPSLLIVQAGPGLPILNEVEKFQRRLRLEEQFLVAYWEQRGCGAASREDAMSGSFQRQVDDLRQVLRWLHEETKQTAVVFGISLGATIVLRAVEHEPDCVKSVVAVSVDIHTVRSDAAAHAFLQEHSLRAGSQRLSRRVRALEKPPYVDPAALQRRARLLADLGAIERGKTFNALLREALVSMVRTYGVVGAIKALRNMNLVQRTMLPELVALDLFAAPPRLAVPVHSVFGEQDALLPATVVKDVPVAISAPGCTVRLVPDAGHMVHFDQPDIVRSIAVNA
jgi:pimeloyl-ACP methyl ester carboxylesterase